MFCLTIPKNFVGEPFGVSENFWYRKILCFRRLCHDFLSKFFCLTVPKNFVEEPFSVSLISGIEKFYASESYVTISIFCRIFFVSQCRKYSQVNPSMLCFRKFPVAKKFMDKGGGGEYQDFPSKFFCLTVPKISVGESFTVALISGSEKVYGQEGGREYQDFPSKIFCLTVPKISVGNPLLLH